MMKRLFFRSLLAGALALGGLVGCSDRQMHLDKLQSAFESAPPNSKAEVAMAVADINATNYPAALSVLQKVAFATKMTGEQRKIMEDTLRKVRDKLPPPK